MAKVNLLGVQNIDFENNQGDTVKGIKLHVTYKDENVAGEKCDSKFISAAACKNLGIVFDDLLAFVGSEVDIEQNLNGKVVGINPV